MNQQKIISLMQFQLPAIAWCVFIFTVSALPSSKIPSLVAYTDKIVHAGVFGVLCWLLHVAFYFQPSRTVRNWSGVIAVGMTMVYGALDEYHQLYTPGRSSELLDFIADSSGAAIYLLLNYYLKFYPTSGEPSNVV